MAFNKHHIWGFFIIISLLVGCGAEYSEQVNKFRLIKVNDTWTFKFPYNLKETQLRDNYYQRVFHSPDDSIVCKVAARTMTVEGATRQFDLIAGYEKRGEVSRMCMGSLEGDYTHYNFIDSANMLSGTITDYVENGQWEVWFDVIAAKTGDRMMIAFEKIPAKDVQLFHAVIASIRQLR